MGNIPVIIRIIALIGLAAFMFAVSRRVMSKRNGKTLQDNKSHSSGAASSPTPSRGSSGSAVGSGESINSTTDTGRLRDPYVARGTMLNDYRGSLLVQGIVENKPRLVEQGLNAGENPNRRYSYEEDNDSIITPNPVIIITPIVQAAVVGNVEIARLLIEHGADPNVAQRNGESALADAANTGNVEMTRYLLEHGADPNISSPYGTPLALADGAAVMKVLIEHGADPNIPDRDGDLPIIGSMDAMRMDEIELLIMYGTDMNHQNWMGETPLEHAGRLGLQQRVQEIISRYR